MKKITIITLLLCSLFATMIFGGCSPGKNNDNNTTNDPGTSDEESTPAENEPSEEIVPADIEVSEEMTSSDNKAEEETTRSKPLAGANGNAKSDCQEYEFRTPEGPVPKELLVTEPIKTIKYFQSVLTGDPSVADYATEEMMARPEKPLPLVATFILLITKAFNVEPARNASKDAKATRGAILNT